MWSQKLKNSKQRHHQKALTIVKDKLSFLGIEKQISQVYFVLGLHFVIFNCPLLYCKTILPQFGQEMPCAMFLRYRTAVSSHRHLQKEKR